MTIKFGIGSNKRANPIKSTPLRLRANPPTICPSSQKIKPQNKKQTAIMRTLRFPAAKRAFLLAIPLFVLLLSGCGGGGAGPDNRPERVEFSGKATLKGSALQDTFVTFHPDSSKGYGASAKTDDSGNFVMGTFTGSDGVVPGTYQVSALKQEQQAEETQVLEDDPNYNGAPPVKPPAAAKSELPAKFQDPKTSGVTVTVTEANDEFILEFN